MTTSALPLPVWWEHLSQRAGELLHLPLGWDSYGASVLSPVAVEAAFRFLGRFMADDLPTPELIPTSLGGVNVEWHLSEGCDIEIEFHDDGGMEALIVNDDEESVFPRGSDPSAIVEVVPVLLRGG